ncbi:hypothetical protein BMS3Abin07_00116 [bacterium BMS3Abin07]|nr:hypothetical protein BMS3Abin07_00116 [bacterium BMS3Abin07]GBE32314.1 hypothetical protein BMS3Bbin05_01225 [bacterium BMS3Bbin05]HDO22810.1 YafY family transcriptional regulator [Nitrospirota bacterium]HDZ87300.1 YafY family transcriptional regulator [Nitrospirota bacterium]
MSDRLKYERFLWFHERVKAGRYPNAGHLAHKYEISPRTAQRDIGFMRDRLNAPLEYDHGKRGYFCSDNSYELPSLWFTEDNIVALSLAVRLASSIPDSEIKQKLCELLRRILNLHDSDEKLCFEDISEKISVKNIEYSKVNEEYFHEIVNALFNKKPLVIAYYSPHKNEKTVRTIFPLHLLLYMGTWHIVAYCTKKNGLRDFVISRIRSIDPVEKRMSLPVNLTSIKKYVRKNFGIMQGGETVDVHLRFSSRVAEWVREQAWHPDQRVSLKKDGTLSLCFPVSDFRELKHKILGYGTDVKVVSPKSLASQMKQEIEKMGRIY